MRIERVTGKPYAQVVQERILTPQGMEGSGYDLAAPLVPRRANRTGRTPSRRVVWSRASAS